MGRVCRGCRFIQKKIRCLPHQCRRQHHTLPFPAGKRPDIPAGERRQFQHLQHLPDRFPVLCRRRAKTGQVGRSPQHHHLLHREPRQFFRQLVDRGDLFRPFPRRDPGKIQSIQRHGAGVRLQSAVQQSQQRTFAGPVGAQQHDQFPSFQRERDILKQGGLFFVVTEKKFMDFQHGQAPFRRFSSQRKTGPPVSAVITPMGISRISPRRETMSQSIRNTPPPSTAGSTVFR